MVDQFKDLRDCLRIIENAQPREDANISVTIPYLTARALLAEVEALRQDAARYLAFFDAGLPITFLGVEYRDKASLDEAIDAALRAKEESRG